MSRTAHHIPYKQTRYEKKIRAQAEWPWSWRSFNGLLRSVELYDLRYTTRELRDAEEEGRRPQPRKVRRAFEVYAYCCAWRDGSLPVYVRKYRRADRNTTRMACRAARFDPDTVIEPSPNRHRAHRDSW
ncbi:hypothetical protein [Streptomyces alanosinicus]|uniref:Uncharacterized protein n=1 Tax=Streptomyces alanosinicus TaxID=68171 RepID=A0A918YSR0_9ACTN|nr:hypothetical protein [Streptomyces alanosinicus]GHE14174.1 hypothetical protein GCM10010339_83860 [Streptomyces alanosinicus]